jgi:MoxR-like ATPase
MTKSNKNVRDWKIFLGSGKPHSRIKYLPNPPNWRKFREDSAIEVDDLYYRQLMELASHNYRDLKRGQTFYLHSTQEQIIDAINAALYLRRPLLVTGRPGSGKTSLAYAIAYELQLGPVLMWPITVRSSLSEGLYQYDAIARLQDVQLLSNRMVGENNHNIGDYLRLGPLGTAFLPNRHPRVLLIDEIDKADINLPNDLLNLFEEGRYQIPELVRLAKKTPAINVFTTDGIEASIMNGDVQCAEFPLVILTSNGERDFPPAFLRRCLRVNMPSPSAQELHAIVRMHLGTEGLDDEIVALIYKFLDIQNNTEGGLATDQLLNTVYLLAQGNNQSFENLQDLLLKSLTSEGYD